MGQVSADPEKAFGPARGRALKRQTAISRVAQPQPTGRCSHLPSFCAYAEKRKENEPESKNEQLKKNLQERSGDRDFS